jgi:hypothetical protein
MPVPQPHQTVPQILHRRITGNNFCIAGRYKIFIALVIVQVFTDIGIVHANANMRCSQQAVGQYGFFGFLSYVPLHTARHKLHARNNQPNPV